MTLATHRRTCTFDHDAFIYDSDTGYVETLVPLLLAARSSGDTVLCIVPRHNGALLRDALGGDLEAVELIDAGEWYAHPIDTIARYEAILRRLPDGTSAFVVGEVQFGDTEADWSAWTRYEAALNATLDRYDARVVCPYDARVLPDTVIENARRTHPYLLTATDARRSTDFLSVADLFPHLPPTVVVPDGDAPIDLLVDEAFGPARRALGEAAAAAGFDDARVADLTLAINEVVTNAVEHGGGRARLRVWIDDGALTCVVDDDGPGHDDPLLGYAAPPTGSPNGYGAWIARRLFDRSELLRSPSGGLRVALQSDLPVPDAR